MATSRQATARPLDRDAAPASADDARRRWMQVTSQMDGGDGVPDDLFDGFPAPGASRGRPAPAAPPPRAPYTPAPGGGIPFAQQRPQPAPGASRAVWLAGARMKLAGLAVAGLVALVALYVVLNALFSFLQVKLDDMQYGMPRTTHLDAYVGHSGEQAGQPSHFMAINLDRRIVVIELPGGDTKNASTITGPYLFGDNENLTPVQLSAQDVNGDGAADLLLTVKNEELIYINDKAKNSFHLLTPDERAKLPALAGPNGGSPVPATGAQK